jgi:transposase
VRTDAQRGLTARDIDRQTLTHGLTVSEVAKRYRVGEDKVRGWIRSGVLRAINTADARAGKPRYVIMPEYLAEFERGRCVAAPQRTPRARRRAQAQRDYFPD